LNREAADMEWVVEEIVINLPLRAEDRRKKEEEAVEEHVPIRPPERQL